MVRPHLLARVEQINLLPGFGVASGHLVRLGVVAQPTGEPKIPLPVGAATGTGNEVFDFQSSQHQMLRTPTVSATIAGLFHQPVSYLFGNFISHGLGGCRSPRRTASRTAMAFRSKPSW